MNAERNIKLFTALEKAAEKAGGRYQLHQKLMAAGFQISRQSVNGWKKVPLMYIKHVARMSKMKQTDFLG